jgi:uncharacterized protein YhaN
MRLRRLDLTRYGKFTDRSLDFGEWPAQGPDFHIIYGPNEAGKSTTMQGWLDLLYGIPAQSRMDFLHPYGAMRLGACIEAGGDLHEVIRTKGRTGTLSDPAGNVIPEALLQGILGGIDRAGYEAMFSLDDDTLEKGGESILSSQGDLGQMLFTASSGLAEMGQALDDLRAKAHGFFRPGGRSGGLVDLKKELAALEQAIQDKDVGARDYATLVQERDGAQEAWAVADAAQALTLRRLHEVERLLAALPLVMRLRRYEAELAELPVLPPLPEGWANELAELSREHGQIAVRIEEQGRHIAAMRDELAAAVDDPAMLAQADAMAAIEMLKADRDGALRDLPNRRAEAASLQGQIDHLFRQLGHVDGDVAALLLPAPLVADLRALMERHSGVAAALDAARAETRAAAQRQAELAADTGGEAPPAPDLALLEQIVQSLSRSDPDAGLDRARAAHRAACDKRDAALARLAPWQGDGAGLAALTVPAPGRIREWRQGLSEARHAIEREGAAIAQTNEEMALAQAALDSVAVAGEVTVAQAAEVRARRERLWSEHRAALTQDSADRFEAALREDDQLAAAQARVVADAQQRAQAQSRLAALGATRARQHARLDEALQAEAQVRAALAAAVPPGLDPATTPDALEDWMHRRDLALEAHEAAQAAARDESAARDKVQAGQATLGAALSACGHQVAADAPLEVLMVRARLILDRARDRAAQAAAVAAAANDLARRQAAEARAAAAMQAWQADWQAACAQTALGDAGQTVAAMGEALDLLQQIERHWTLLRQLKDRIAKMDGNCAAFDAAMAELARALALPAGDGAALWPMLRARLQAAQEGQAQAGRLRRRLQEAAQLAEGLAQTQARHVARLEEMCAHFGGIDTAALPQTVAQAQRRDDLLGQRDHLARDICETMGTDQLDQAVAALDGLERPALAAERDGLSATQAQQAQALQALYARLSQAQARLDAVGGDDAVAQLQAARQTKLLEIADAARGYLRLRLGAMAVDHALQGYRDTHRSAMMHRASEAFRTITRGEYSGLAAQPEAEREVLVAIGAEGGSKLARDLSKGTRFQLYLALRVAGYHEIAGARTTVPFIADDIMETFDDDRAAETFSLLAEMARVGQVIYLTHHRHLCDIAGRICPAVRIHALG